MGLGGESRSSAEGEAIVLSTYHILCTPHYLRLIKERFWDIRSPDVEHFIFRWSSSDWIFIVNQVAVGIMLDHEPMYIIPVVEDLTSKNMSAHPPAKLVTLLFKPLMSKELGIEIVYLKGAMVDMDGRLLLTEEGMMVDVILTTVEMEEAGDIPAIGCEKDIRWLEGEIVAIEFESFVEVGDILTVMTEFVH